MLERAVKHVAGLFGVLSHTIKLVFIYCWDVEWDAVCAYFPSVKSMQASRTDNYNKHDKRKMVEYKRGWLRRVAQPVVANTRDWLGVQRMESSLPCRFILHLKPLNYIIAVVCTGSTRLEASKQHAALQLRRFRGQLLKATRRFTS